MGTDEEGDTGKLSKGEPPVFTAVLRDRSIEDGSAARFDVRVRGHPEPKVIWYKDEEEITMARFPHIKLLQEGDLHSILITEGTFRDAGVYKCCAENSEGQVSCTSHLFVEGLFCQMFPWLGLVCFLTSCDRS